MESNHAPRACWPGVIGLDGEKTAAASVWSLANNLPANAADLVKAVHGAHNGRGRLPRQAAKHYLSRARRTRPVKHAQACGKRALEPIRRCELQGVNETSTPPSHSYAQLQPRFCAPFWRRVGSMRSV